jgi:hypothetical protein
MNELDNTYMERIAELARKKGGEQGLEISAVLKVSLTLFLKNIIIKLILIGRRI